MAEDVGGFAFERIASDLEGRILSGEYKPGHRLPTDAEQAASYGVNPLTVRRAMEMLRQRGLVLRQQRRGSFVAQQQRARPCSVAYVGDCEGHLYRDFFHSLREATQQQGGKLSGYHVCDEGREAAIAALPDFLEGVDAAVIEVIHAGEALPLIRKLVPRQVLFSPTATLHSALSSDRLLVELDDIAALELALFHLLELGHRRIGFLSHSYCPQEALGEVEVFAGPGSRLRRLSRLMSDLKGSCLLPIGMEMDDPELNQQRMEEYLGQKGRPSAIICDGDYRAQHVYLAAAKLGISIPGQLSMVGINDTPWSRQLAPALTTVNLGEKGAAELAARLCLGREPVAPMPCRMVPRLVQRSSTARCQDAP